ncbi:ABC transporter permease [Aquimarina sp. MMG015]|uniref:ABC transporter permease n=1 Tax=unclassified Aquimarina TaxID=2627091 RepID=UPI000E4DB228|nr:MULTISPECIES: FtsX-like permease family protein [unclassified Aquimarina]AXT54525.1 ABC transporter permease [Aquimarina sp. AD1]MBQ4804623.1 ABC transporter permease [Aquimarina sp. MMG015]RKN20214.1 FtsX-like permease family protein [Aquimarina sp. AD1]
MLSVLLLTLSILLATFVLQISKQLNHHLEKNSKPFDMVVGAKGSPLQLVLSTIFHIDNPTGNISLDEALRISKNPMIKEAIPVSYGDNYKGYKILGTSSQYLLKYNATCKEGKLNTKNFEAVLGSKVASNLNLSVGSTFVSSHGLIQNEIDIHDDKPFVVSGILVSTGTVVDDLIITNLESIWEVHEHPSDEEHIEGEEHTEHEEEHKEITALLLNFRNPIGALQLSRSINKNSSLQAALPKLEIDRLLRFLGVGFQAINGIAIAILLVAGLSIFTNLIKTVRERKHELALLRTYGATNFQLLKLVFYEALSLSIIGCILGWILGRGSVLLFATLASEVYQYQLEISIPDTEEFFIFTLVLFTTILATIFASYSLFKLNISKILADA